MADHFHDIRYLVGGYDTSPFTFRSDLGWHLVLLRLENGGLVKADG